MILKKISLILLSLWCVSSYSENRDVPEQVVHIPDIEVPLRLERLAYECFFKGKESACNDISRELDHYFNIYRFHLSQGDETMDSSKINAMINRLKSRFCEGSKSCKRRCIKECQKNKHTLCEQLNKYSSDNK